MSTTATAPTSTVNTQATGCLQTVVDYHNDFMDWTSKNLVDIKGPFRVRTTETKEHPADSALMKATRVFFGMLAAIVLLPFSLIGSAYHWVKEKLCSSVKTEEGTTSEVKSKPSTEVKKSDASSQVDGQDHGAEVEEKEEQ